MNGTIENNKWYAIKIRCEGNNVKVSIDGTQILDVTDPGMANSGHVGIGTWSTQAQFRNIKVTSLDGRTVLFEGVPPISQQLRLRHWETSGGAVMSLDTENVFNGKYSIKVESNRKTGTLLQRGVELKQGETYLVSMWVKEHPDNPDIGSHNIAISFYDSQLRSPIPFVSRTASIHAENNGWRKLDRTINAVSRDESNVVMALNVAGTGTYYIDQVSIMPKSWAENGGFRPDLLQAIADLKPPVIRYPGGCFASAYRWKDGIGPQEKRQPYPFSIWDDLEVNSFGTDEFIRMCRAVGAEPMIVINIGTPMWNVRRTPATADVDWLQEALDWLEYCNGPATSKWGAVRAANGHPEPYNVKYWEIDNELETSVEDYVAAVKKFVPAMKAMDPSIKIAACGSWRGNLNERRRFDSGVINGAAELFDWISFHHYEWDANNFATGPLWLEDYFREIKTMIDNSANKNIKIFDSEWNAQSTDWRTGLYAGGLLNVFERCGDFLDMAAPALFLRHTRAGGSWDNAFINFNNASWFPAPNYVVMKLWREHYAPTRIGLEGDQRGLNLIATKSEDGKTLYFKAVNPTNEVRNVTLNVGADMKEASLKLVTARGLNDRNTLANPNAIAPRDVEAKVEGGAVRYTLPAYSAGVLVVQ